MSKFLQRILVVLTVVMLPMAILADDYQLPDPSFEDWSGAAFDGNIQPKYWHASNVEQSPLGMSFKFNFAIQGEGRTGKYCIVAQDKEIGALGITETSPGYYSLGYGWQYVEGVNVGSATAGTKGGYAFTHRPDSISIWIKRTGPNVDKEDFHVLYYAWTETAKGSSYKNKSKSCTSTTIEDEESDIRILLNGNECKTDKAGGQVCEGWWRERKTYDQWTNLRIPIYYINDNTPKKCNLILSASNYPNFRANDGLYDGNSLYVDDVELIYSSKIQTLKVGGKEWKGFDPNSTEVQVYSVPEGTTTVPAVEAYRGAGSLTNPRGTTKDFPGRKLTGSEITITNGTVGGTPTTIVVKAEDGSSTMTYKILFQAAKSSNAKLANIYCTYTNINNEQVRAAVSNFSPSTYNYKVELPYGSKGVPTVEAEKQEDEQTIAYSQPASLADKATITVTAANGTSKQAYNLTFEIAKLADNTLKDIQVNGKSIPGFTPSQAVYKVSLPTSTTTMPTVTPVSAYADGEQTIVHKAPPTIDGGAYTLSVTTPGNTVAKVYKLNFKLEASSYSYLKDLKVGDYIKNFEPTNTTYYVHLPLGTTALPDITWTVGDEYQKVVKSDLGAGVVDGTVRVTVTAGNGDQTVYKIVFSTEKSERSTLKGIQIGGVDLEGFDPDVTTYAYALPVGTTTLPEITPIPGDEYQTISVTTAGLNGKTRITVTAGNGTTTIYQIAFSVATFSDNTLQGIYLDGVLIEGFEAEKDEYYVNLPQGTTVRPAVTYQLVNENLQTASVRDFSGLNGDYKITVRPQSGASRTYIIHFSVATSSNTDLLMIYLNGVEIPGFRSDSLNYIDSLPEGVTTIPTVTFRKAEESQRVLSVLENKVQRITVTAESGAKKEYTVRFIPRASANAFLNMIYLDGVVLPGFKKEVLEYSYPLTGETCPAITVDKAPGQQVTITAPFGAGDAIIKVLPEDGSGNTYTIHFIAKATSSAQLASIAIDDVSIPGFRSDSMNYKATYEKVFPTVTYTKKDVSQTVQILWKDSVAWLHVADTLGNKAAYSVAFSRIYSSNNALEGIYADGVLIPGFDAATLNYSYDLAAGSDYPEITYEAKEEAQVVFFGQLAAGKWGITVTAEDGTIANYTVQYNLAKYADATLKNMSVVDKTLSPAFDSNIFSYNVNIDEGEALPQILVETREGQTVYINNVDADHQEVTVFAESGATNTYNIAYTRNVSNNALLADILIDGVSLAGFDSEVFTYVDSLDRKDESGKLTSVVPNVFPIGKLSNQTITTYFCKPNGTTKIHVEAQDGSTTQDYFIYFPVRQSNNNFLGDLYLDSEEADLTFKKTTTDYTVILPYTMAECPKVIYEKDETEQRIDFISRPIGDTTKVIVVAENGESRTYNILFKREVLNTKNLLASIYIPEIDKNLSLKNKDQRSFDVTLPYGARTLTVEYEKSYDEQTVFIEPGGVNAPTIITVKANNDTVADEIYRIIPSLATQNPAVLNSIKVDGVDVPGFDPNRYTYIVNRSTKAYPKVSATKNSGVETEPESSMYKWECTVSKDGFVNKYTIFFHYVNDIIPNSDFTQWGTAVYNNGAKPTGWQVPADFFKEVCVMSCAKTGSEVVKTSSSVVGLETTYWSAAGGALPAIITLGKLSGTMAVANKTHYEFYDYIDFMNTPDEITVNYKHQSHADNGAFFAYRFKDANNTEYSFDFTDNSTSSSYKTKTQTLTLDGKPIVGMNIAVDATNKSEGASSGAKLYVDWFRLSYNSTPKTATVNGLNAPLSGKVFTATLTDPEEINLPSYEFNGEVSDQAQLLTWAAPVKEGDYSVRRATIRNFAEDGTYTDGYSLEVKRPLDTRNQLASLYKDSLPITGFDPATTSYTIHVPAARHHLHDLIPVPASSLQTVTSVFNEADSTMIITVTPEKGEPTVYTVKFITDLSDDTTLTDIKAEGVTYNAETHEYTVPAEQLPLITFEKKSDLQSVSLINGVITVTAENGAVGTYTITAQPPVIPSTGVLSEFYLGTNVYSGIGGANLTEEADKPDTYVAFTRAVASDSVVFVQDPEKMQWAVEGSTGNTTYTWTYSLSDNTDLANIKLDGHDYEEFDVSKYEYDITPDTTHLVEPIGKDGQTLVTTFENVDGVITYTTVVTAANKVAKRTYTIKVARPKSSSPYLAGLMLDTTLIADFDSLESDYTVTLPVEAVKRENPKMPSITYIAGHEGQTIEVEPGQLNGTPTTFTVHSEDGFATKMYNLTVNTEKSHCSDLTGITVNGEALDYFEPGRHFYSVSLKSDKYEVDYTSDDRFQTVTSPSRLDTIHKTIHGTDTIISQIRYTIHVEAENGGADTSNYEVMIYFENQSNDAKLANITLDGENFENFERALNANLTFDSGNNNYTINLPYDRETLPEVSAQLKMDGQKVEIFHKQDSVILDVTAVDEKSHNRYVLHFLRPLSKNADLSMIYINGDSLQNFEPGTYFYHVNLAVGVHTLPEVDGQKAEVGQTILTPVIDQDKRQATIKVLAQDQTYTATYVVAFQFTQSDVDTLSMIYQDGDSLKNYRADSIYYAISLPVGTAAFPDLSWENGDEWQTITMSRLDSTANSLIRQINVTSESMRTRTYTVSYTIEKSNVDTLQMIFVQQRRIENFEGKNNEYTFELTASEASELNGRLPVVEYITGDDYQSVFVSQQTEETLTGKTLGYKSLVTVTAASGATRTYTIHYPVQKSDEATLNMINVGGKPLSNFISEQYNYKQEIDVNAAVPVVTVIKKEEIQVVEISINEDTVSVLVTAEDGITTASYSLIFERVMSSITTLQRIILINQAGDTLPSYQFPFIPEERRYTVNVPYESGKALVDQLPNIETVLYDPLQVTQITNHELDDANVRMSVTVIAPNGEDEGQYEITFHFIKPSDANLTSILVKGTELEGFTASNTEYNYAHPYGSSEADYFTAEDVQAILSDPLATATVTADGNGKIFITVVAQDGTENTYTISQSIAKDNDCFLSAILLEDEGSTDTISGFDPEVTFYTYYLRAGATTTPNVDAIARSLNAVVDIRPASAGDTCLIICTADDQTEKRYYIHFAISTIDESAVATASDVIVKRVPGAAQLFVGTLRRDVHFALFDGAGRLLFYEQVPTADPNDVELGIGEDGYERLNNIVGTEHGLIVNIELGKVYFYTILYGEKNFIQMLKGDTAKRLRYGKIIAL